MEEDDPAQQKKKTTKRRKYKKATSSSKKFQEKKQEEQRVRADFAEKQQQIQIQNDKTRVINSHLREETVLDNMLASIQPLDEVKISFPDLLLKSNQKPRLGAVNAVKDGSVPSSDYVETPLVNPFSSEAFMELIDQLPRPFFKNNESEQDVVNSLREKRINLSVRYPDEESLNMGIHGIFPLTIHTPPLRRLIESGKIPLTVSILRWFEENGLAVHWPRCYYDDSCVGTLPHNTPV